MKPMGIDACFRIIRSTPAEDAVWDAVRTAIDNGMTPDQFKREAAQAWEELLREDGQRAVKTLIAS
jgi:hypothetical protein